jgi:hypothetical protein
MLNPQNDREQIQQRIKKLISSKQEEMGVIRMNCAEVFARTSKNRIHQENAR